jgi:tetratricopeptide (TPR) repeat protein
MNCIPLRLLFFLSVCCCGCGLLGDKTGTDFSELLTAAPYKPVTDSINKNPSDAGLFLRRAALLTQNNHHDIAYYDYKKSWELKETESTAIAYASNLFITGKTKDAVELLKKCMQQYPANTEFMRRLGEVYTQAGKSREALSLYDEILKKDSLNFEALYEKGLLFTKIKDTANAIAALEKAYRLQPTLQNGLALANLYAATKNEKTIALCDSLQQRDTAREFVDPVFMKGVYYSNTLEYSKAIALFDECINRDWKFIDPYLEKGIIFYEQKNYDEAIKTFQFAINVTYSNPDAYYWIGRCCEAIGKKEEALDYYFKALAFDRDFTEAKEAIKRLKGRSMKTN